MLKIVTSGFDTIFSKISKLEYMINREQIHLRQRRLELVLFLGLFVVISLVYYATFYPDQNWGDDFAQYIHQSINISRGVDMADTGYIYSRYTPGLGPRAYPPGFPLLLAPTYAIFGLNIGAFQAQIILMQLLALLVIYLLYRREVTLPTTLTLLLMMGLSPYIISFKREIRSDVPFMLLSLAFLGWVEYVYRGYRFNLRTALVAALLVFACYLIRTIGFVAVIALLVSDLIRRRRPTSFTLWTIAGAVILVVASRFLLGGGEESYLDQLANYSPLIILRGIVHYLIYGMQGFWAGPSLTLGQYAVPILWLFAIPLIIFGFIQRLQHSTLFMEFFFLFYLAVILAWPTVQELRFLYPILPLFLLYAGIGIEVVLTRIGQRITPQIAQALAIALIIGVVIIYAVRANKVIASEGPITDGPYHPTATAMFQFVSEQTSPEATFVFYKPRALSLYTQRHASTYPYNESIPVAVAYLREIGADYAVVKYNIELPSDEAKIPNEALITLINTCADSFTQVFDNEGFKIYRINQDLLSGCQKHVLTN